MRLHGLLGRCDAILARSLTATIVIQTAYLKRWARVQHRLYSLLTILVGRGKFLLEWRLSVVSSLRIEGCLVSCEMDLRALQVGVTLIRKSQGLRLLHVIVALAHLRLWALANLTLMVVETARPSEVIKLVLDVILTSLHALFSKFLLGRDLNT